MKRKERKRDRKKKRWKAAERLQTNAKDRLPTLQPKRCALRLVAMNCIKGKVNSVFTTTHKYTRL